MDSLDWSHVNPATGPLYIAGARPGDVLRIDLLELKVGEQSSMVTIPGEGALGDVITQMETAILKREGDQVVFKDKIRVALKPMIGVIGVAPAEGEVPTGTPGPHGGNMDCTLIAAGNRVYFTVGVEGALFGAGDLHAAMGDGEIVVCGAETAGAVRFTAQVVDLAGLPTPFVETGELVATIYSAPTRGRSRQRGDPPHGAVPDRLRQNTAQRRRHADEPGGAAKILPGGRPAQDGALRVPQVGPGRVWLPDDVIPINL